MSEIMTADLFTPGRASYLVPDEVSQESLSLVLTEASESRGRVTAQVFDPSFHVRAVFAGGYPGAAQAANWPKLSDGSPYIPAHGQEEAYQIAVPLVNRLRANRWTDSQIDERVFCQGDSSNSLGDVALSIQRGYLDPDYYADKPAHGTQVAAGPKHGYRFIEPIALGLDIDPARVQLIPMRDIYGTPETPFLPAQSRTTALIREQAATVFSRVVMADVRAGNLDSLLHAALRFDEMGRDPAKALKDQPIAVIRAIFGTLHTARLFS